MKINTNYLHLKDSYLFSTIAKKIAEYREAHPEKSLIRLGIGDVTRPLCPAVVDAMRDAAQEQGNSASFHGYGPEQGYAFLRDAVRDYYASFGVAVASDEIFISDGAKSDLGNILDIFDTENTVLVPDPVYPVYVDTNVMAGRKIRYMNATPENGFLPLPEEGLCADIVYLCSPNNPTGAVYDRAALQAWVNWANTHEAVILFDAAYESFISDAALPRSIFEIEGATTCAIEFCSFSKTAGFTGVRCGYTVVPHALIRGATPLSRLWLRRQTTKFNGVSYVTQRGAAAVFSPEGQAQVQREVAYYKHNARVMTAALTQMGIPFTGGENSPYVFMQCPRGMDSWTFFDWLLENAQVAGTPGAGFGTNGEGYFRLTAFGTHEDTEEAMKRISDALSR